MSTRFCSPILTIGIFRIRGARPCIALSHSFLPSHYPSILPCFVTSTLWGGNPFLFHSSASNSMVFFATRCCVLMSAFDLLDGSYSSSLVVGIFFPLNVSFAYTKPISPSDLYGTCTTTTRPIPICMATVVCYHRFTIVIPLSLVADSSLPLVLTMPMWWWWAIWLSPYPLPQVSIVPTW